jgi:hypothetical protein
MLHHALACISCYRSRYSRTQFQLFSYLTMSITLAADPSH